MILSVNSQAVLFLTAAAMGAAAGLAYDCIKIFRLIIKHGRLAVQIEDGLYWVAVGFVVFAVMLDKNYGEIRFFSVLGIFLGMGLYFLTLSRIIMSVSDKIISFLKKCVKIFIEIVLTPFKLVWMIISTPVKKFTNFNKRCCRKGLQLFRMCVKIKYMKLKRAFRILLRKR